jgi:hypothetical protein
MKEWTGMCLTSRGVWGITQQAAKRSWETEPSNSASIGKRTAMNPVKYERTKDESERVKIVVIDPSSSD